MRAVAASRLHLCELIAVLLEDLCLPSQAQTLAQASKWRVFFSCSTAVGVVQIPREDVFFSFSAFVSTLCCPVIRRFRGIRADHRGFPGFHVKRFSAQFSFFGLVSYSVRVACVHGEKHVGVCGAALFWPWGAASLSSSATK